MTIDGSRVRNLKRLLAENPWALERAREQYRQDLQHHVRTIANPLRELKARLEGLSEEELERVNLDELLQEIRREAEGHAAHLVAELEHIELVLRGEV